MAGTPAAGKGWGCVKWGVWQPRKLEKEEREESNWEPRTGAVMKNALEQS